MTITVQNIITAAALLGACLTLLGALFAIYRWYLRQGKQDEDIKHIKQENALIVEALFACLDGLEQLGANHTVPQTKGKLSDHLNARAHE